MSESRILKTEVIDRGNFTNEMHKNKTFKRFYHNKNQVSEDET